MAIKKELTPESLKCLIGACPAIFETTDNSYLVIGKLKKENAVPKGRVGSDEVLIEIPKELLAELINSKQ